MNLLRERLKEHVNLDAYALSENFYGYFEVPPKLLMDLPTSRLAFELFWSQIGSQMDKVMLICALGYDDDYKYGKVLKGEIEHLCEMGWLKRGECIDYDLSPMVQHEINESNLDALKALSYAQMTHGTYGHIFLVNSDFSLICYPHNDVGFGFIVAPDYPKIERLHELILTPGTPFIFDRRA